MSVLSARDVLAGALAVHRDLLRPEDLAAALADWQREPDRPLGEVLAERLGQAGRDLAPEADRHLGSSSGTPQPEKTAASFDWAPPSPTRPTAAKPCRYLRLAPHAKGG